MSFQVDLLLVSLVTDMTCKVKAIYQHYNYRFYKMILGFQSLNMNAVLVLKHFLLQERPVFGVEDHRQDFIGRDLHSEVAVLRHNVEDTDDYLTQLGCSRVQSFTKMVAGPEIPDEPDGKVDLWCGSGHDGEDILLDTFRRINLKNFRIFGFIFRL